MEKADLRTDAMEKRFDRRISGITKLLQQGMRVLAKTETTMEELAEAQKELAQSQKELAEAQKELAQAQKETDRTLKAFINSLRQGRNGR